ncbi:MAG TPA: MerR family transcriptional regulator [Chthonomonadaceae bacterium]|nr:MerR family transcriptional regulator [Chthonomonadaceae bacterium]
MHTIKFAARHTGLSPHIIRTWERRYGALTPDRTATNRRLYSNEDMEKLTLLHQAVQSGHSIGQIAGLSLPELQSLTAETIRTTQTALPPMASHLEASLHAVEGLDAESLEYHLTRAAALLGAAALIEQVILPLLQRMGDQWREGELRPAQEHMATAILRTFLGRTLASFQPPALAPRLIVTTPVGQLHELGALIAAVTAASEGWRVLYLGPNLPAEEVAGAVHQANAAAVALSLVYPPDDPRLVQELVSLRTYLGPERSVFVGGRAATAYRTTLDAMGFLHIEDMQALRGRLEALRSPSR